MHMLFVGGCFGHEMGGAPPCGRAGAHRACCKTVDPIGTERNWGAQKHPIAPFLAGRQAPATGVGEPPTKPAVNRRSASRGRRRGIRLPNPAKRQIPPGGRDRVEDPVGIKTLKRTPALTDGGPHWIPLFHRREKLGSRLDRNFSSV